MSPPNLHFFKDCFGYLAPLHFHIHFRIGISISGKKKKKAKSQQVFWKGLHRISRWIWGTSSLTNYWGLPRLLIHEQCLFIYLGLQFLSVFLVFSVYILRFFLVVVVKSIPNHFVLFDAGLMCSWNSMTSSWTWHSRKPSVWRPGSLFVKGEAWGTYLSDSLVSFSPFNFESVCCIGFAQGPCVLRVNLLPSLGISLR